MNQYIFLTAQGTTYAPWDISTDEASEIENTQMLGIASGENQQEAKQNLLEKNPQIAEAGFNSDEIFGYELAEEG